MMNDLIAFCGLDCSECGALIATREDDDEKRKEVAAQWSAEFKADIKPGDINCLGCGSKVGPLFSHCRVCEIRACGHEKAVLNCAYCQDYACDKLSTFLEHVPEAKVRLDQIRLSI
jgi:hypothetical protein